MVQNCVDQRSGLVTGRRVHHHSRCLVDDQHMRILIHNFQWKVLQALNPTYLHAHRFHGAGVGPIMDLTCFNEIRWLHPVVQTPSHEI